MTSNGDMSNTVPSADKNGYQVSSGSIPEHDRKSNYSERFESQESAEDNSSGSKKRMKKERVNPLEVSESLGYQTFRRKMRKLWTKEEDELLRKLVDEALIELGYSDGIKSIKTTQQSSMVVKEIPWDQLAKHFLVDNKKSSDVKKRWTSSLDPVLKKGKWTAEEDELLLKSYEKLGPQWLKISYVLENRTEDQCAKRYIEVLDPSTKNRLRPWDEEEDLLLISKVKKYGTKWRQISTEMDARPSLTCRNRWRKIITMLVRGIASATIREAVQANGLDTSQLSIPHSEMTHEKSENSEFQSAEGSTTTETKTSDLKSVKVTTVKKESDKTVDDSVIRRDNSNSLLIDSLKNNIGEVRQTDRSDERPATTPDPNILNGLLSPSARFTSPHTSFFADHITRKDSALPSPGNILPFPTVNARKTQSDTTVDWKFTLKDLDGHSLSNGVISNADLVKELIEHAKSNKLKISIHQHIHNHYLAPTQLSPAPISLQQPLSSKGQVAMETAQGAVSDLPKVQSPSFSDFETDFLSRSPNFNSWGLEDVNPSPTQLPDKPQRFFHHHHHHHHDGQNQLQLPGIQQGQIYSMNGLPQVASNTESSNTSYASPSAPEIREIGPSRHSHFNYLPPTMKPHLGSSENAKALELSRLLNPSPNSENSQAKRKKTKTSRKKHSLTYREIVSSNSTNASPECNNTKSRQTPSTVSSSSAVEEEGNDFWEDLRTLHGTVKETDEKDNNKPAETPAVNRLFQGAESQMKNSPSYDSIFNKFSEQSSEDFVLEFAINPS